MKTHIERQPRSGWLHRLVGLILFLTLLCSCERVGCINGRASHAWGKWHNDGRVNLYGNNWLVRECSECGLRQGTPEETK